VYQTILAQKETARERREVGTKMLPCDHAQNKRKIDSSRKNKQTVGRRMVIGGYGPYKIF